HTGDPRRISGPRREAVRADGIRSGGCCRDPEITTKFVTIGPSNRQMPEAFPRHQEARERRRPSTSASTYEDSSILLELSEQIRPHSARSRDESYARHRGMSRGSGPCDLGDERTVRLTWFTPDQRGLE